MSTYIVAVTVDSLSTEMFGGAQFFASTSTPSNHNMVTTRVPSMDQLRDKSQQNLRWSLPTLLQGVELL